MKALFLLLGLLTTNVFAHERLSGKGYFSCLACHTQSTGSGLLTDYGKGIARAMSLRSGEYKEGSFKKALRVHGKIDHAVQVRVAHIDHNRKDRIFPMQTDYLMAMKVTDSTQGIITIARADPKSKVRGSDQTAEELGGLSEYFVRKALVQTTFNDHWLLEVGRDELAFGLKWDDHTLLVRSENKQTLTDLPTQARLVYEAEAHRHFLTAFLPNGQESESNRERGFATKHEWQIFEPLIIGLSTLMGSTEEIKRKVGGLHIKANIGPFTLLGQMMRNQRETKDNGLKFDQDTRMIRLHLNTLEWFTPHLTHEWLERERPFVNKVRSRGFGASLKLTESISFQSDFKQQITGSRKNNLILSQIYINLF